MKKQAKNKTQKYVLPIAIILIVLILVILSLFLIKTPAEKTEYVNLSENTATRIIDGDTFELASGDIVRLICIDTPEEGKEGYEEATDFLFSLVYHKEVRLEKDIDDKDKYGRLLRYVYVRNENISDHPKNPTNSQESFFDVNDSENPELEIFVNKEIVKKGYGTLFLYGNNTEKCGEIENE